MTTHMKKKNISILCFFLLQSICLSAQGKTSETDVQILKSCYNKLHTDDSLEAKKSFFDAFPATFTDFKKIFGYVDTGVGDIYGDLYDESLIYITEFFYLNEVINPYDFSDKVINLCINGEWQADGVNYLHANVVNIVTSYQHQDCYFIQRDFFSCYNDTLRETLLYCLAQRSEEEILSFWQFYLDEGDANQLVDENLYNRTEYIIQGKPVLLKLIKQAYFITQRGGIKKDRTI